MYIIINIIYYKFYYIIQVVEHRAAKPLSYTINKYLFMVSRSNSQFYCTVVKVIEKT